MYHRSFQLSFLDLLRSLSEPLGNVTIHQFIYTESPPSFTPKTPLIRCTKHRNIYFSKASRQESIEKMEKALFGTSVHVPQDPNLDRSQALPELLSPDVFPEVREDIKQDWLSQDAANIGHRLHVSGYLANHCTPSVKCSGSVGRLAVQKCQLF